MATKQSGRGMSIRASRTQTGVINAEDALHETSLGLAWYVYHILAFQRHDLERLSCSGEKRTPIYSLHVHPDGSRLATGSLGEFTHSTVHTPILTERGVDTNIRVWSTLPILRPDVEKTDTPKLLCTMSMHSGKVARFFILNIRVLIVSPCRPRLCSCCEVESLWEMAGEWLR